MCEGIARAGKGICLFAVNTESILGKCARLFRAGRTPFVQRVQIDWGVSDEDLSLPTSVNFLIPSPSSRTIRLQSLPAIQQVPTKIQDIHAGTRANFFVILKLRKVIVPQSITLRGELDDGSGAFELPVPIQTVQLASARQGLPLIHTLAAWHLIQEHAEQRAPLPQPISAATDSQTRKAVIVHLGEKYQLASEHTSFIAVDSGQDGRRNPNWAGSLYHARSPSPDARASDVGELPTEDSSQFRLLSTISNFFARFFQTEDHGGRSIPGAWTESPLSSPPASDNGAGDDRYESAETFSTLSSLDGSSDWSDWSAAPSSELRPQVTEEDARRQRSSSPQFESRRLAPEGERTWPDSTRPVRPPQQPPPVRPEVVELVKLQLYDGSFLLHSLRGIVGANVVDEVNKLQVDNAVWATALSIAFIEKHMRNQKELMADLLIKAQEFLRDKPDIETEELIRLARELVS